MTTDRVAWLQGMIAQGDRSRCWPFPFYRTEQGYGQLHFRGQPSRAHRVAWMLEHDMPLPLDRSLVVMHECDNPPCCNPDHLRLGPQSENIKMVHDRGQIHQARGEEHGGRKLTDDDVRAIRASTGPHTDVALRFGISAMQVGNIRRGKAWRHVS